MRQSQILTSNRSSARARKGVIHHVPTPKMPTFSVAIGLLHLPSGTWGITPLHCQTTRQKTEKHHKKFAKSNKNY